MKKLLLSLTAIAGIFGHAQTALHGTDWALKKIVKNNTTYNLPQNGEIGTPILTFTQSSNNQSSSNLNSPICGTNIWAMLFDAEITANSFNVWSKGVGNTNTCTLPENIAFYTQYSDYFSQSASNYNYQITYADGGKNLIITNNMGDQAFYQYGTLGAKEAKPRLADKKISIYPNPIKEGFVYLRNAEQIEWIKVYNMEGKLILQDQSSDFKINVSNLLKGGYFMEVKSQSGISRHQFIKE